MSAAMVHFSFRPGLTENAFHNVRLVGSWDADGKLAADWSSMPMAASRDPDGCPCFDADVTLAAEGIGALFRWGVRLDGPAGDDLWAITCEVDDESSTARERSFVLQQAGQSETYWLTLCGRLGANRQGSGIRFSAWAPNARSVDLVLANPALGYVADDGSGVRASVAMAREADGIWRTDADDAALADFAAMVGCQYMFRITKDNGAVAYRTDIISRMQIGRGDFDPDGSAYPGPPETLQGPQSCSVVCDPGCVVQASGEAIAAADFWHDEFSADHPLAASLQDLVIYELHVGALGYGKPDPGTLDDAIAFVDHLAALGVNAVELMPISQFESKASWGYGTSHFFAIDQAAGGADRLKLFVKTCHQRGIAVILDVCYNHFDQNADRAEWAYDSDDPTRNIYFYYEGQPGDYADPSGGYIDNMSSGFAPRYDEEIVRQLFISSAVSLVTHFHVDGFRLDQTSAIHQYPALHANAQRADGAAAFGVKFLKQWTRTMRLINPGLFLSAEDYSGWSALTTDSLGADGLGFNATWFGDFQHHLVQFDPSSAQLLQQCGFGDTRPLAMDRFAGALQASGNGRIVYSQSHDDCGNRQGSARAMVLAVNGAPLVGETRRWAAARVRVAAGLTLLCAGTPMFFMGEEIGAAKPYRYSDFTDNREDIVGAAAGADADLFGYYKDLVRLSERSPAIRGQSIEIAYSDNDHRVLAFHRWDEESEFLVVACLANAAYESGYWLNGGRIGGASWTEIFNSDSASYGGWNIGNESRAIVPQGDALNLVLPASGLLVLERRDAAINHRGQ